MYVQIVDFNLNNTTEIFRGRLSFEFEGMVAEGWQGLQSMKSVATT